MTTPTPIPYSAPIHTSGTSNAITTATINAVSGVRIKGIEVHWSYSADPASGSKLTLKRGATVIEAHYITASGPGFLKIPFKSDFGEAISAVLDAGGSGVYGNVTVYPEYE